MGKFAENAERWPNFRQRFRGFVVSGRPHAVRTLPSDHPDLRSQELLLKPWREGTAFQVAGAKTCLPFLLNVLDVATAKLMELYD